MSEKINVVDELKAVTRKTAAAIHDYLRSISLPDQDKPILIAGVIIALEDKDFRETYQGIGRANKFVKDFIEAIENSITNFSGIKESDKEGILVSFNFVKQNKNLNEEENDTIVLKELTQTIEETIYTLAKEYPSYDVIAEFYGEFTKYSSSDQQSLGIVLTPHHIAEFMSSFLDVKEGDTIVDICCGSGSLLLTAEASDGSVGNNKVLGVELNNRMMALCVSNMIIRNIDAHLWLGSSWKEDVLAEVKEYKPTKMILNPPYSQEGYPELGFVKRGLDLLEKGGKAAVIIPMSCAIKQTAEWKQLRKEILSKHTLLATFSMPDQLFYPVGTVTIVMIFEAGTSNAKNETFFGYLKDDGFEITRTEGRKDVSNKWSSIKNEMISLYENKEAIAGKSALANVDEKSEWCCEAYMETDYSETITEEAFFESMKAFAMFSLKETES